MAFRILNSYSYSTYTNKDTYKIKITQIRKKKKENQAQGQKTKLLGLVPCPQRWLGSKGTQDAGAVLRLLAPTGGIVLKFPRSHREIIAQANGSGKTLRLERRVFSTGSHPRQTGVIDNRSSSIPTGQQREVSESRERGRGGGSLGISLGTAHSSGQSPGDAGRTAEDWKVLNKQTVRAHA